MTPQQFQALYEEFMQHEEALLGWKAGEYATGRDRLQNFREIAALTGMSMSQVALTYLLKHIQSIKNAVITGRVKWCWETPEGEGTKQRIADSRNYLALLAACMDEEAEDEQAPNKQPPASKKAGTIFDDVQMLGPWKMSECPIYRPKGTPERRNCGTCERWTGERCGEEERLKENIGGMQDHDRTSC